MAAKYKDAQSQKLYDALLVGAADKTSELYHKGEPRRGAGHRAAFWDGFSGKFDLSGPNRSANVIPRTLSAVCFQAGREWARRVAAASKPPSNRGGAGRSQGRKPLPNDEVMKQRGIRMTDQEWDDAKYIGTSRLRALIRQDAAAQRAVPDSVLQALRKASAPRDAYQLARELGKEVVVVGRALRELEQQGAVKSDEDPGTANDLGRSFRVAPGE